MCSLLEYLEKRIMLSGGGLISFDELAKWPVAEVQALEEQGKLVQTDDADGIMCRQCPEGCWKEVEVRAKDGRTVGVIHCEDEECGGLITLEIERLQEWKIIGEKASPKPVKTQNVEGEKKKEKKSRPSMKKMQTRNEAVAMIAAKFQVEHERLPTVDDIMNKSEYTRQQIYSTDSYKEGKIAKNSAKPTDEMTGKSVTTTELFSNNSLEHTRADRKSKADQALVDGLIEEQQGDDASRFVK